MTGEEREIGRGRNSLAYEAHGPAQQFALLDYFGNALPISSIKWRRLYA